jgi:hypothetical protein
MLAQARRTAWVIWYCVCLHLWWGLMLLLDPAAAGVTAINSVTRLTGSVWGGALVFLVVGGLAAVGLLRAEPGRTRGLVQVLPQQAALLLSALGACEAIWRSTYADGVPRPRAFIAADQIPAVFIALAHTAALIDCFIHGAATGRERP